MQAVFENGMVLLTTNSWTARQNFHKLLDREIAMQAAFENGMVLLTTQIVRLQAVFTKFSQIVRPRDCDAGGGDGSF